MTLERLTHMHRFASTLEGGTTPVAWQSQTHGVRWIDACRPVRNPG